MLAIVVYQVPGVLKVERICSAGRKKAGGRAELQRSFSTRAPVSTRWFVCFVISTCLSLSLISSRRTLRGGVYCVISVFSFPSMCCFVRNTRYVRAGYRKGEAVVGKVSDEVACNGSRQRKTRRRGNGAGFFARFSLSRRCSLLIIFSKGSSAARSNARRWCLLLRLFPPRACGARHPTCGTCTCH